MLRQSLFRKYTLLQLVDEKAGCFIAALFVVTSVPTIITARSNKNLTYL
jgi:hypothetical protein